jgi:DNA-binding PadR family transcriptional regulator
MERTNRTKFAVLGILSMGPHSGYDVKKFCEEVLAYFWHESYGQIYPLLHTLESEGLIRKSRPTDTTKDRRVAYVVTAAGKKDLAAWLERPFSEQAPRNELLLKVFFSNLAGPNVAIRQIDDYRAAQKMLQKVLKEAQANIEKELDQNPDAIYWQLTVDLGLRLSNARLAWCREAIQKLQRAATRKSNS